MKTPKIFLSFLAIGQSLAITWTRIGCDDPWQVDRIDAQEGSMTIDPDAIWANADAMSKGAREAIESLSGFKARPSVARNQVGANANFVWGVDFSPHRGLASSSESDMEEIIGIYKEAESALAGTLQMHLPQQGYLFCGGRDLQRGTVPGLGSDLVWYATVTAADGTIDYIIPQAYRLATTRPCTEGENEWYMGKTFFGERAGRGAQEEIIGVVLCPNQFGEGGYRAYATLDEGYPATTLDGNTKPYIGHYNSVAGTLLHEMVHVVGHARDPRPPPIGGYKDRAAGFLRQFRLGRGKRLYPDGGEYDATRDERLHNPDGYRLFAEMCRSPDTQWGFPDAQA
ncbi:hypothetical protein ACHAPT_008391 [Fusarium lateritium]